jgi:hypothetical protein
VDGTWNRAVFLYLLRVTDIDHNDLLARLEFFL